MLIVSRQKIDNTVLSGNLLSNKLDYVKPQLRHIDMNQSVTSGFFVKPGVESDTYRPS